MNGFFKILRHSLIRRPINSKMLTIPLIFTTIFLYKQKKRGISTLYASDLTKKVKLKDIENLQENEIREIKYGSKPEESILVMRYDSKLISLSSRCPHYGAPMKDGFLYDNLIKCPWHGASFDITTGMCETGPSLDGLKKYEVIQD